MEEQLVYHRIRNEYPLDEKTRDISHDDVYEQFEKKVFRKPYALRHNDMSYPIRLFYIWSQYKDGITKVTYITEETTKNFASSFSIRLDDKVFTYGYSYLITVPTVNFVIYNNEFGIPQSVSCTVSTGITTKSVTGTITLKDATSCICSTHVEIAKEDMTESIRAVMETAQLQKFEHDHEFPVNITESTTESGIETTASFSSAVSVHVL